MSTSPVPDRKRHRPDQKLHRALDEIRGPDAVGVQAIAVQLCARCGKVSAGQQRPLVDSIHGGQPSRRRGMVGGIDPGNGCEGGVPEAPFWAQYRIASANKLTMRGVEGVGDTPHVGREGRVVHALRSKVGEK